MGAGSLRGAIVSELTRGLQGLLGEAPELLVGEEASVVVRREEQGNLGNPEGFRLKVREQQGQLRAVISSPGERGLLYGTFAFLRFLQLGRSRRGWIWWMGPAQACG